uniref:ATP-dependent DNA helicase 2 subunit KU70-like n=1 Tax=Nicotiana tabacum TaxID=4097 RepID=A0A1S3X6P3_TOBAC|nr:PREDICTED: ATP-dependent DNA helicase 2 subunit KU70-like [Nicotiana tabacum]
MFAERFDKEIGSKYGIVPGSRENSLYNALWVAQALLRKGSAKTADKRMLLFTNEDDPFGNLKGVIKVDMMRTTLQRAKDAQDLGIAIELLPLSRPDDEFNVSLFYTDLLGLEGDDLAQFKALVGERYTLQKSSTVENSSWIVVSYSSLLICLVYVWLSHILALVK